MHFFKISLLLAAIVSANQALAIHCTQASTPTEIKICNDKDLKALDQKLSQQYRQLSAASAPRALVQSQKTWLAQRDACGDKAPCITDAYTQRMQTFTAQLDKLNAYQPDATDKAALEQLRAAIALAATVDAEFPLEKALKTVAYQGPTTSFSNGPSPDKNVQQSVFPTTRPAGVSAKEWALLRKSPVDTESEHGNTGYTLIDLDGDGLRDLVIDAYIGGTGLFNYISTSRQVANTFAHSPRELYSVNGRGGNQEAQWVQLQGRVYAVYRDSFYGQDHLSLLRPFEDNANALGLLVRYSYRLTVPKKQVAPDSNPAKYTLLDEATHKALNSAVRTIKPPTASATNNSAAQPLCPVPKGTSEDESNSYMGYGPGHYSFEIVADFPVWIDKLCHVAQLINWFGSYKPGKGLLANLHMRRANSAGPELTYSVEGLRKFVDVQRSAAPLDK
jgi:uncharacterized protein